MDNGIQQYLLNAQLHRKIGQRWKTVLPLLSLLVAVLTFWCLKLTGITLAGEAFCGKQEHVHSEACSECTLSEHIHTADCYSNLNADLETEADWEATLVGIQAVSVNDRIAAVAQSQLGYTESSLNFQVDAGGNRHGYTRYGQWYGNPYGDWSAMFASFCLHYGGAMNAPISSGAESMRLQWEARNYYRTPQLYTPEPGDVLFLDKNGNGAADVVAIVTSLGEDGITVIEGDHDNRVAEITYSRTDPAVMGYGLSSTVGSMLLLNAAATDTQSGLATAVDYSADMFTDGDCFVLYVRGADGNYYAIDGNGSAVLISVDANGSIITDLEDTNLILWSFTYCGTYDNQPSYYIQNLGTQKYLHPYADSATNHGVLLSGRWESALYAYGTGVRFRGARQTAYAYLGSDGTFSNIDSLGSASTFYFARAKTPKAVWFDGTNGGLMSLAGSPDKSYSVEEGSVIKLPETWQSPTKYSYKLQGWYDVKNSRYYLPGAEITVTENMVFYADWIASSYDFGQFNAQTTQTVSTKEHVTTRLFDFGPLFNVLSANANVSASVSGHSETWSLITSGLTNYGNETLNFIFRDWDSSGDLSYPGNLNDRNTNGGVYSGLYTDILGDVLFGTDNAFDPATGTGILGKTYLGTGDYLFQFASDPNHPYYGYYYYDSALHAASYSQSDQRFYVYDYLEATSDSLGSASGKYSDFLPFNSPYNVPEGQTVRTYTYDGMYGEYVGTSHVLYDAKYNTGDNAAGNTSANYAFGMSMDVNFYLPDVPGTLDENGNYGNQDLYGQDMHFEFSGDDDLWVLVDGKLALDLGGIHGAESGTINFSTGIVTVNGEQTGNLYDLPAGEHVLTVYYLERGSSQSNNAIYFNIAPRFSLRLQKEDVLTQELLNGAQFSVYMDQACTIPAQLWSSEADYEAGMPARSTFTVVDGVADIWGLSAGKTYYIRETHPPDAAGYSCASGIIRLSLDKRGVATYSVDVIAEESSEVSGGFTVHGVQIDEQTQHAFIVVTNAQDWVKETTTVQAYKQWDDQKDHSNDYITVYLTVTDPDGTVRRIRQILLSHENDWTYLWTNLPKYGEDGVTEIQYGVEEAYLPGYQASIEKVTQIVVTTSSWAEAYTFTDGGVYILKTSSGCLSAVSTSSSALCWVDEETAKSSVLSLWTATVSGSNVKLTNGAGQILSFNYGSSSSNRYFYVTTGSASYQTLRTVDTGTGIRLYCIRGNRSYYLGSLKSNGYASASTGASSGLVFAPMTQVTETTIKEVEDWAFRITNIPLEEETSLTVHKYWDMGTLGSPDLYQQAQVTIRLLANGKDTGRSVTLTLKNNWQDTFYGLPYRDENGGVIVYTVEETWQTDDYIVSYGAVLAVTGDPETYEVTVTNTYRWGHGVELPSTGGFGPAVWHICGYSLILLSLVLAYRLRRKHERGKA